MIEQSLPIPPDPIFFADSFQYCKNAVGLLPYQVMGLVPAFIPDTDDCRPESCYCFIVFANESGNERENDTSFFLFDFPSASGNDFRLEKYISGVWTDINILDNTTGVLYDFGAFPDYPLRSGVSIDWSIIYSMFGVGYYRLSLGDIKSYCLDLRIFDCDHYDETVRIETVFDGLVSNIHWDETLVGIPKTFDLKTMNWNDQARYKGVFGFRKVGTETVIYTKSTNRNFSHKEKNIPNYDLTLNMIPPEVLNRLESYGLPSDKFYGSNYDNGAEKLYRKSLVSKNNRFEREYLVSKIISIAKVNLQARYDETFNRC